MAKKSGKKAASKRAPAKTAATKTAVKQTPAKQPAKLSNAWQLARAAAWTLWGARRLFIGITLVYAGLNIILAQGLAGGANVSTLKNTLDQISTGHVSALSSGLNVFAALVGSVNNNSNATSGAYQLFLALMGSLAIIWALRRVTAGLPARVRDAYYRGMYPLVPFVLVLIVIGLQLLPLLVGSAIYGLVMNNGIAVYSIEKVVWTVLFAASALASLYMISSSAFALYIVTLPDMTPVRALRRASDLVRHRRWLVLRKILCLPLFLLVVAAIVMVPLIIWLEPLAQWVFFLLTMAGLVAVHAYMYTLYRELDNE